MASSSSSTDPWSDLPPELVGLVVTRLPEPADIARSRAVCRSWHWAVRHHGTQPPQQLPRIVNKLGEVTAALSTGGLPRRLPSIPDNAVCLASTQDWLLLGIHYFPDEHPRQYRYRARSFLLHNASSNRQVPLTELDAVVPRTANIRKFFMRTCTADDPLVAVITDNNKFPFILVQPGKGRWLPKKPQATPYIYIIDIAFLGDKLYAITKGEDLIPLHLASDHDGRPVVTIGKRVIRQPEGYHSHKACPSDDDYYYHYDDDEDEEEEEDHNGSGGDGNEEERTSTYDDEEENERRKRLKEFNLFNTLSQFTSPDEMTYWHLIESCGKLLMLKRVFRDCSDPMFTCRVDVFEADFDIGAWVPMVNELGRRALFVSNGFSKFVVAPCGEVKEDTIYFIESGEVFNMKTQTSSFQRFIHDSWGKWLFPPDLVL